MWSQKLGFNSLTWGLWLLRSGQPCSFIVCASVCGGGKGCLLQKAGNWAVRIAAPEKLGP